MTRRCGCPAHGKDGCDGDVDARGKCEKCYGGACIARRFELLQIAKKRKAAAR